MTWILERLKEKSTWAGIATIAASAGLSSVSPELFTGIGAIVISVIGLYEIIRKERADKKANGVE